MRYPRPLSYIAAFCVRASEVDGTSPHSRYFRLPPPPPPPSSPPVRRCRLISYAIAALSCSSSPLGCHHRRLFIVAVTSRLPSPVVVPLHRPPPSSVFMAANKSFGRSLRRGHGTPNLQRSSRCCKTAPTVAAGLSSSSTSSAFLLIDTTSAGLCHRNAHHRRVYYRSTRLRLPLLS